MRKKAVQHMDARYTAMIENAYYYSNPPEGTKDAIIERPPMHQYIRKLLYKDLSKVNVERVSRCCLGDKCKLMCLTISSNYI